MESKCEDGEEITDKAIIILDTFNKSNCLLSDISVCSLLVQPVI